MALTISHAVKRVEAHARFVIRGRANHAQIEGLLSDPIDGLKGRLLVLVQH
jgi:hypothetical protein